LKYVNQSNGRSIDNTGWLASLIVTILLTDGRSLNDDCNKQVAFKGGHWSESFRTDGLPIGTDLRRVPSQTSVANYVEEIRARAEAALGKLVVLNIASSITVNVKYNGNNVFYLDIESKTNEGLLVKLGLNGTRLTDAFAWNV
jgi:phage gp46-like protein